MAAAADAGAITADGNKEAEPGASDTIPTVSSKQKQKGRKKMKMKQEREEAEGKPKGNPGKLRGKPAIFLLQYIPDYIQVMGLQGRGCNKAFD